MYNFKIKSIVHDYEVQFINDIEESLNKELIEGDIVIIDRKIEQLYNTQLNPIFEKINLIGIDATEVQKSYEGIIPIINTLIESGFRKNHRLIAIGGGITQDVTAFIASIMYRGVDWIFYPTTLLAQGDSCIGSKTSINFRSYKNQVGGFYPPNKILIYPIFLDTLQLSEIKSGMGEMLHYFVVSNREDFNYYKDNYRQAFTDKSTLSKIISRSLKIKKEYIEIDEFDRNVRQAFNYGHSFGHAIESLTNYNVPHGIAVSFGMDMANYVSVNMGFLDNEIRKEIREIASFIWEGYTLNDIDAQKFLHALSKDKKNVGTKLGLILNKGIGKIFKHVFEPDDTFNSWISDYFNNEL